MPAVIIIANPAAGGLKRKARVERFAALLRERGASAEIRWTRDGGVPGDNLDLVEGGDLVVAAGGDGTLHQVANILYARRERRPLGFFPAGTANVFAHEARLPGRDEDLADLIVRAPVRQYPLGWGRFTGLEGEARERVFLLMAGVGWDARVTVAVNHRVKRMHGKGAYALAALGLLITGRGEMVRVLADGREATGKAVIVAGSRWYAGPYSLVPAADPTAPRFALAVIDKITPVSLMRLLRRAARGEPDLSGNVRYLEAGEVEFPDSGIPIQVDGDQAGWTPAVFRKGSFSLPIIGDWA